MALEPQIQCQQYRSLKNQMDAKSIISLHDISIWDQNSWSAWKDLPLPNNLKNQWAELKTTLTRAAPINKTTQDNFVWDPSGEKFTVKSRYNFLQPSNNLENWNLWIAVWKNECLPKIKIFAWTLLKGKILTTENLRKKGIQGPSMSCLC